MLSGRFDCTMFRAVEIVIERCIWLILHYPVELLHWHIYDYLHYFSSERWSNLDKYRYTGTKPLKIKERQRVHIFLGCTSGERCNSIDYTLQGVYRVFSSMIFTSDYQLRQFARGMLMSWNGNIFRVNGHLCREFTDHRWIPCTKASAAELWSFLSSAPAYTVE